MLGQQQQGAAAIGGVVWNHHVGAVRQIFKFFVFAGVGAQRLQVHSADAHQVSALGFIELVQVRLVLEEVGVQALFGDLYVWLHVVGEDFNLQIYALFGECRLHELQDFGVGHRRRGNLEGLGGVSGKRGNGGESNQ